VHNAIALVAHIRDAYLIAACRHDLQPVSGLNCADITHSL
jgi:hypothetical protein